MSIDVVYDIWSELRRYMSKPDRVEAADCLVNVLIDNDYNIEDISHTFKGDNDIKAALKGYIDDTEDDLDNEYDNRDDVDHEDD